MPDVLTRITSLLKVGEFFTYETFSTKSARGYPNALSAEWLIGLTKSESLLGRLTWSPAT